MRREEINKILNKEVDDKVIQEIIENNDDDLGYIFFSWPETPLAHQVLKYFLEREEIDKEPKFITQISGRLISQSVYEFENLTDEEKKLLEKIGDLEQDGDRTILEGRLSDKNIEDLEDFFIDIYDSLVVVEVWDNFSDEVRFAFYSLSRFLSFYFLSFNLKRRLGRL